MSRWDDAFEQHPVFASLDAVRERLEASNGQLPDADAREVQARISHVADYAEAALKSSDPELVPTGVLDQIASALTNAANSLQQFEATPQTVYLDQAGTHADTALTYVAQLPSLVSSDGSQDLQGAISSFRRSAGQHTRYIEEEVAGLRNRTAEIKQQLDAPGCAQAVESPAMERIGRSAPSRGGRRSARR